MYNIDNLELLLKKIVDINNEILSDFIDKQDNIITNEMIFISVPESLIWVGEKIESTTYKPSEGILDLIDYLEAWKESILKEYMKKTNIYLTFISDKDNLFNDIMLKCIAAEKTADLPVSDMDSILELRVKLLNLKLISTDIRKKFDDLTEDINNDLIEIKENIENIKKSKFTIDKEMEQVILELKKFNTIESNKFINYISENIFDFDNNQNNIIKIDESLGEIVKIVTVSSIMVSASDKKREIAINNYNVDSIEYLTATTFMKLHEGRDERELGKTMKETVNEITAKKEYTKIFKDLVFFYSDKL